MQQQSDPRHDKDIPLTPKGNLPTLKIIEGEAFAWAETGTEGLVWAIQKRGVDGYDGLYPIEKGDHLIITSSAGKALFDGIVDPDYQAGTRPRFKGDKSGQPAALGCWIHWTQRGWNPDDWARLFVKGENSGKVVK